MTLTFFTPLTMRLDTCVQLRLYIHDAGLRPGDQLPPERELANLMGLSRGKLRVALARMRARGEVWQHVGRGTFVGGVSGHGTTPADPRGLLHIVDALALIDARLLIEPQLACLAAERATKADVQAIKRLVERGSGESRYAPSQLAGESLHRAIAVAARSELLLWMFDHLFTVRSAIHWGRLTADAASQNAPAIWREHADIAEAIAQRDVQGAHRLMKLHLVRLRRSVAQHLALEK